ncbi:MAG: cyclic beta,2-glucan synthetase, partial [Abditibacteriota bacterium]|nr:cyclic beta,2-glucan synthetase [Abditibacteriota bacterium]
MNTSTGLVLGFFRDHTAATRALSSLRGQGCSRSASIRKDNGGRILVDARELSDQQGAVLGGVLGFVAGSLLPLAGATLPAVRMVRGLTVGAGTIVGAATGRLLARNVDLGLPEDVLQSYRRSVMRGETLVLVQVPSMQIEKVLSTLRESDDHRPTTFIVRAALGNKRPAQTPIARSATALKENITSSSRRPFPSGDGTVRIEPLVGDRLKEHARRTATRHAVMLGPGKARPLLRRLRDNERVIGGVNHSLAEAARLEQPVSLSAEWLLDNSYIIQSQVADVRRNLSHEFYAELPVLMPAGAKSPRSGTTRAYGIARDLVAHTDARLDVHNIEDYVSAYQNETPLTMGELWALPLMFRVALIENLRRLTTQVDQRQRDRERADFWSSRLLAAAHAEPDQILSLLSDLSAEQPVLHDHFSDRLISHLYDEEAALVPVRSWIESKAATPLGEIIQREQRRQAADQISVANTIGSLRTLGQIDWSESFERLSLVEHTLRDDPAGTYAQMDFATRDAYRHEVERIARGVQTSAGPTSVANKAKPTGTIQSTTAATRTPKARRATSDYAAAELVVARRAVEIARQSPLPLVPAAVEAAAEGASHTSSQSTSVTRHIGYFLVDKGVHELEGRSDYSAPLGVRSRNWLREHPETAYLGAVGLGTGGVLFATLKLARHYGPKYFGPVLGPVAMLASGPASELAVQFVNYMVMRLLPPRALPKLNFEMGIPDVWRTLVVVPMMLSGEDDIREEVEKLEVRYLANPDANLRFALLADYLDAGALEMPEDKARLEAAKAGIEQLNRRYGQIELIGDGSGQTEGVRYVDRFLLFNRERRWSPTENKWMGWERKRGKLEELNAFLCGEDHGAPDRLHPIVGNRDAV